MKAKVTLLGRAALAVSLPALLVAAAHAAEHYVPSGGASEFPTIQDALNSGDVSDGDTIFVTGGGPYGPLTVGKSVTIENTSGSAITISGGGNGVLINNNASPTLDGFTISGNSANGIAIESAGTVTILNSVITANNTGGNDSAIQIVGAISPTIVVENSQLNGNARRAFTNDFAGAGGTLIATNSKFNDNGETAIFTGAPGTPIEMDFVLNNCSVDGNGTGGFGRGIQVFGGSVTINGGSVSDNSNQGLMSDGGVGGVVFDVEGAQITGNGEKGVGLFAQGEYTFVDSVISNNTQQGIHRIFNGTASPTVLDINGTQISGNTWEGVFIEDQAANVTITGSEFLGNADGADSQLRAIGGQVVNMVVERSFFDWNNSGANLVLVAPGSYDFTNSVINGGGGGVGNILAENGGTFSFNHCTIVSAAGGSAAGIFSGGGADCNFTVTNTIFAGVQTAIVNHRAGNNWSVDYSLFHPNDADIGGDEPGAVGGIGANSLSGVSPEFVEATTGFGTGDFALTAASPALAAGAASAVAEDIAGLDRPNPVGSAPDMGAHEGGPVTTLSTALVDFGSTLVDTPANGSLQVVNDGVQAMTVSALDITGPDAAAFSIDSPSVPFDVNPSASIQVNLVFETSTAGSYTSATLEVSTNDAAAGLLTAALEGQAFEGPAIGVSPPELAFGSIPEDTSTTLDLDISNTGDQELAIDSLTITGDDAAAFEIVSPPSTPFQIGAGAAPVTITVAFDPPSAGSYTLAALEIGSPNAVTSPVSVDLSGTALSAPSIDVAPAALNFGAVEVGQDATLDLTITNNGDQDLVVDGLSITGTDEAAYSLVSPPSLPLTVSSGSPAIITVEFAPAATGSFDDAAVSITSNDTTTPTATVNLSGEGTPVASVSGWMLLHD